VFSLPADITLPLPEAIRLRVGRPSVIKTGSETELDFTPPGRIRLTIDICRERGRRVIFSFQL
jgi:hypothetical protein